jgi:hypothetical protein
MSSFTTVLEKSGLRPEVGEGQHITRHYSETFSKETAHWLRNQLISAFPMEKVLTPEAKIKTIYGDKSLDVAVLDKRNYLMLDISIKTFHFKDKKTNNYRHNYTGRFYELLGEELDIRRSYKYATLAALIFLPEDSVEDTSPSSFALAVKQFSKITKESFGNSFFEYVFVVLYSPKGTLSFFNASEAPPAKGMPVVSQCKNIAQVINIMKATVNARANLRDSDSPPKLIEFDFYK